MDYVQHPYFTDENVEKERGIIGQEIQRYDDEPMWKLYINTVRCLYDKNPITIDTAGTIETISHITKETLYSCYNTFYHPSNMIMCISGDFEVKKIIEEVKKRLLPKKKIDKIKRIYPQYEPDINKKYIEKTMDVNMPQFMIGYRDFMQNESMIKKNIAIKIICNCIIGKCSKTYQELYEKGLIMRELDFDFEFGEHYSHILISGESNKPKEIYEKITLELQNETITEEDFERSRKRLYGELVTEYDDVENIGRMYLSDSIKGIDSMKYIDEVQRITLKDVNKIKEEIFIKEKSVLSIIKNK